MMRKFFFRAFPLALGLVIKVHGLLLRLVNWFPTYTLVYCCIKHELKDLKTNIVYFALHTLAYWQDADSVQMGNSKSTEDG